MTRQNDTIMFSGGKSGGVGKRKVLGQDLDKFAEVHSCGELLGQSAECLLQVGGETRDCKPPLGSMGSNSYMLGMTDACLVPAAILSGARRLQARNPGPMNSKPDILPEGVQRSADANLLLSRHSRLVMPDSYYLKNLMHPVVDYLGEGHWEIPDLKPTVSIEASCFYLEFLDGHFGHALVDTPARLWALEQFNEHQVAQFQFVAYPRFGIKGGLAQWPRWLRQLLDSYGVMPDQIRLINESTQVQRLIVPRRISPFRHRGGLAYNQLMRRAGDRLLGERDLAPLADRKLFLSRSHMSRRQQDVQCNLRLESLFESAGFEIVHPQESSLEDQVHLIRCASHIAGCVGSQLHMAAFANQPSLKILRIAPSCFNPAIDHNIAAPVGYQVDDFVVARDIQPGFVQDTTPWSLDCEDFESLGSKLSAWL